jgi:methylated-DNA-protein-cysteine methyltransferase-like protein
VTFRAAVHRLVRRIPRGRVATYGQLAGLLGQPRSARAVGTALRRCPADLPWYRVVNARGGISARRRMSGMITQRIRLQQEGVSFRHGRVVLHRHQWGVAPQIREDRACGWR